MVIVTSMSGKTEDRDVVILGIAESDVHGVINSGLGSFLIDEKRRVDVGQTVSEECPQRGSVPTRAGKLSDLRMLVSVYANECGANLHDARIAIHRTVYLYSDPHSATTYGRCRAIKDQQRSMCCEPEFCRRKTSHTTTFIPLSDRRSICRKYLFP